jgi:hypothetical protein
MVDATPPPSLSTLRGHVNAINRVHRELRWADVRWREHDIVLAERKVRNAPPTVCQDGSGRPR